MATSLLVVDDEIPIQAALEQTFTDAGYDVSTASDGIQAIDLLELRAGSLGALITDLSLGRGPDGWQVARRARELAPTLPVVYITGGRGREGVPTWAPDGVMLLKPFTDDHLLVVVSALLYFAG